MLMWGAITFGIGMALVILEIYMASKKKEGMQSQDKQRIMSIFSTVCVVTGIVMGLIWLS